MVQYFPGASTLIVGPAVAALTTDAELGKRLWPLISRGATGSAVLEEALRNGLARTPDLMVIEVCGSQTRVVARGAHNAHLRAPDGNLHTCNGADVSTWTERVFEDALGGTVDAQAGPGLPIVIGMVLAGGFAWGGDSPAEMTSPAAVSLPTVAAEPAGPVRVCDDRVPIVENPAAQHSVAHQDEALRRIDVPSEPARLEQAKPGLTETRTEPADDGFDHLFGSTVYRTVEDAAVREILEGADVVSASVAESDVAGAEYGHSTAGTVDAAGATAAAGLGDHDGSTIMAADLVALRGIPPRAAANSTSSMGPSSGPPPAVLLLSTGEQVALDRGVVIGRRPQVDRVAGSAIPRLVTVESPQQDISRSHLQITRDSGGYVATDLHSMNGTVVNGVDGATLTLGGGEQHCLRIGDVLDLGDGVTVTVRALT